MTDSLSPGDFEAAYHKFAEALAPAIEHYKQKEMRLRHFLEKLRDTEGMPRKFIGSSPQYVTATCLVGHPKHYKWLYLAAQCFAHQAYPLNQRMFIVVIGREYKRGLHYAIESTHGSELVLPVCNSVASIGERRNMALDECRNMPLDNCKKSLFIQWDSDDFHHPKRMVWQVVASQNGMMAVTLQRQIRYDVDTDCAYVYDGGTRWGIHGTILHPATEHRYPDKVKGEDTEFLKHWRDRLVVLDNDPCLYVRFSHGDNVSSRQHIMGPLADKQGVWELGQSEGEYLKEVLEKYKESQ